MITSFENSIYAEQAAFRPHQPLLSPTLHSALPPWFFRGAVARTRAYMHTRVVVTAQDALYQQVPHL